MAHNMGFLLVSRVCKSEFKYNPDFCSNDFLDNLSSYKVEPFGAVSSQMIGLDGLGADGMTTTMVASFLPFR